MSAPSPVVLYVEDEKITREVVKRGLTFAGFTVLEAGNCDEAMGVLSRATPDCVLIDLILPDGDGVDLADTLRTKLTAENRLPPILALSSSFLDRKRAIAGRAFDEVFTKPVPPARLAEAIRGHIRRTPTDPAMKAQARSALFDRVGDALADIHEKVREISEILARLKE